MGRFVLVIVSSFVAFFSFAEEVTIEVVEIIGSQEDAKEIAGSASVITEEELEVYEYTDIHKILSNVPGVNFRPEEGYGLRPNISIRGTYADRSGKVTLMEDGVLIAPAPYAASSAYYFPTAGRIAGVEVLKGPAAISQGPYTIGGAINLISTPIADESGGLINQELGQDGTSRTHLHYSVVDTQVALLVESHTWDTDGFDSIKGSDADTGFDKDDIVVKLRISSDPSLDGIYHELNIKYQDSDENSDQSYVGLADADFRKDAHSRYGLSAYDNMDNNHETTSFNYVADFGNLELSATMYDNDFARNWFKVDKIDNNKVYGHGNGINNIIAAANAGEATASAILNGTNAEAIEIKLKNNNRAYTSEGTDLKLQYTTNNQSLTIGYRDTEDTEDRFQVYATADWLNGQLGALTVGSDPGYSSNNRLTAAKATAFYINEEINYGALTVNLGYRSEDWEISQDRYVDAARSAIATDKGYPKQLSDSDNSLMGFGASYDVNDTTQLFLGFHEGFTPTGGGADPEEADNLEIGVRYTNDDSYFEAVYFDTDYRNMFGECTASGGATGSCEIGDSFNAGEASISGFELVAQTEMVSDSGTKYPLSMVYTSTDASFDNTFDSDFWGSVTSGMDIPDLPDSQLALQAGFETQTGLRGSATYYAYGSTCSVASCAAGTSVDSYNVIDASLTKMISDQLDVYMVVENITDETDVVARAPKNGARAQKPRSFTVGVRYRL
jgi:Fe(3+) dicitrate transport protein|tara:strand:- start:1797 stop:3983 length:2187 start_codon:yes stop_codon:yes gene_type:complete